ncbi:ubiquitin family protein [Nocardioides okcheonensis]|uniref:hypothetical protein n=1 Tax=Nocardioides okcheonensis TaxID=2894081 RepID=UPI001E48154D|nr:hypothetical protein [Nocardioides okcheonensis]UFN45224.1 hypothetical protein LN652_03130 [Nocardioides okcheonensis]
MRDTVDVPPIDRADLAARTRRLRRRRRSLQAAAAGAALAAVVGAFAVPGLVEQHDSVVATVVPDDGVPVVLDEQIQLVQANGTPVPTGHVGTPVGVVDGQLVWWGDGVLSGPGDVRTDGVRAAFATETGVTYQVDDGTIHDAAGGEPVGSDGELVAAGADVFVTQQDGDLTLHGDDGPRELEIGSDGSSAAVTAVEAGAGTVVVAAGNVVSFFDSDGARTGGFLGGVTGALSPDGVSYAYAPSRSERAQGMRPGLALYDIASGTTERVQINGAAVDLAWTGDALVVLTEQGGSRTLTQCHETACRVLLTDPTGTLALR